MRILQALTADRDSAELDSAVAGLLTRSDPEQILRVAALGLAADRFAACREPLRRVLLTARRHGAVPVLTAASALLCDADVVTGRWAEADALAAEGIALAERHDDRLGACRLRLAAAFLAAARGDEVRTRGLVDEVVGRAAAPGHVALVDEGRRVLTLAALGRGDAETAYRCATLVTSPGRLDGGGPALRVSPDLVEAAVRLGRLDDARRHVQAMRAAPVHAVSPRFAMLTAASAALVVPAAEAEVLFEEALATPDADRWPFDRARVALAYGEHLRRQRRTGPSRAHLRAALDMFRRLGALPWATRAQHGLRATGMTTGRPLDRGAGTALTPDERAVAVLAAAGLTNKQIAGRLLVSHHTVAARLYQVFPKVGVGSRAALRSALSALDEASAGVAASGAA